ncbi:hypothetical protein DdX_01620 [Ditylenchus destructor]|uniref:Uncharacterized protein n=1 Tax=Ditylenchus destructor TaxID=166010 RepID=A0AAD4RE19_9BILA|nr:hypothetical protein DdX_01620 [Ditylenchus destructor]
MKSSTGYILICMILLTALLGLIVLLITVTEQPDLIFDESRKDTTFREADTSPTTNASETVIADSKQLEENSSKVLEPNSDFSEHNENSNLTKMEIASETNSSTVAISVHPSSNPNSTQRNLHLAKLSEIKATSPNDGKFVTILTISDNSFYVVKNNGDIELWTYKESFERLYIIHTSIQIHRAKLLDQHNFFVAETVKNGRNKLNRLWIVKEDGNRMELANVTNEISDIAVYQGQFYFLDRAGNVHQLIDNSTSILEWENPTDETCNFLEITKDYTFVSCQSAILQIPNEGANGTYTRLSSMDSSYSLAIIILNDCQLMAARRGSEEVHVFDYCAETHKPVVKLTYDNETNKPTLPFGEYWTSLALLNNSTYLLALEHISNVIYAFTFPSIY